MPDGQLRIQEGFNSAGGSYTLHGALGLTAESSPATVGEWEPQSLYDRYLVMLGRACT